MGLADLHIHSIYSWDGTSSVSAILKYTSDQTNLDIIAITDHDEIKGAWEAIQLAPAYGIQVIPGSEISTSDGHLLALFINEKIPAGLPLLKTILRVGDIGGLCVAAHPMARGAKSLNSESICQAAKEPSVRGIFVGIEVFNAGLFHRSTNIAAQALAESLPLAHLGNSDSHMLQTIGQAATEFHGSTPADLRLALVRASTQVRVRQLSNGWSVVRKWLPRYFLRTVGWVTWNQDPDSPLQMSRIARTGFSS